MVMNCLVLAKVTEVLSTTICYPCCQQCYSKIFQVDKGWSCSKCGNQISHDAVHYRYRLSFTICDSKTQCSITVFGTTLDNFIGCSADTLHRWLLDVGGNEDVLKASLNETFTGQMFLFGFKLRGLRNRIGRNNAPVSLDDVAQRNVVSSEDVRSISSSLIAYQMLFPNEVIQCESQTLLERLKYHRLVAVGRITEYTYNEVQNDLDSFIKRKSYVGSGNVEITTCDGQDTIALSCGSFSKTSFDLSKTENSLESDSQPSIELPRASKLSLSSGHLEMHFEMADIPVIDEPSQNQPDSSMHQKLIDASTLDGVKQYVTEEEHGCTEVPVFKFCMREESISDSILLQANEIEFSKDKSGIDDKEQAGMSVCKSIQQIDHWSCIPESEDLDGFLDHFQSNVNQSSSSHVLENKDSGEKFKAPELNYSNPPDTCYPMSENLDAFLSDSADWSQQESNAGDLPSAESKIKDNRNTNYGNDGSGIIPESEETVESQNTQDLCPETPYIDNAEILSTTPTIEIVPARNNGDAGELWDADISSQNLINAMKDVDGQSHNTEARTVTNNSCVILESEELFASFNNDADLSAEHRNPKPDTPVNMQIAIASSTSARKGVRFARSLTHSRTVTHIDHLMQTTPLASSHISRRNSCLKVKPSTETVESPFCPGTPDISQELFSPSPIAVSINRIPTSISVQAKCLYQSTPSKIASKQDSHLESQVSESPPESDDLVNSMDLFSDCSYVASCSKSRTRNASDSQDLFSESFDDVHNNLCKKTVLTIFLSVR